MIFPTRARAAALLLAGACGAAVVAQAPDTSSQRLGSDITAPAIDRGIRDNDPPRAVRTSTSGRIDRSEPFLRGSIIVKFRPGTTAAARRAMLASVNGSAMPALSYADFDIVAIDAA